MNDLIKVNYDNADRPTVSGRELHAALEVKTDYPHWFDRMKEYGFTEGEDFQSNLSESTGGRPATDHMVTIPMAKELCMLQRTEKGSFFRKYFIKVEEAWNSPEMIMKRALEIANSRVKELQINVANLTVDNEIMRPKAEYFDELVDRNLLTNIADSCLFELKEFVNEKTGFSSTQTLVTPKGKETFRLLMVA